ncbi:flavodoxin family protein [Candidatus Mcinerneyibacteriota bacterium]|nr:flavodoxin family protein [Candidatus Mcinerneyibacteriota bacterium]
MKEILAINGSPRAKNTFQSLIRLKGILEEEPGVRVTLLSLSEMRILPCSGCMACLTHGIGFCPLKDDFPSLLSRVMKADGLILASPVYVLNVSGLMKNFIDRLAFLCHRPALFRQKGFILVTVGGYGEKEASAYLQKVLRTWGLSSLVTTRLKTPPGKSLSPEQKNKNRKALEKGAARFISHLMKEGDPVPPLGHVMQFHMQRMIFTRPRAAEVFPADYRFYTDLKGKAYYTKARINIFKRGAGILAESLLGKSIRL